ncbi:MAG: MoxR family ATPase [Thermoflexales bacterium]|nr:MoxR family ATPase [Thermoflexales bacterium]MCX7938973.1 MoxR family ATPase [Thermoflexales bacterium]
MTQAQRYLLTEVDSGRVAHQDAAQHARAVALAIIENVARVIIGKRDVIELATIGLLCQGHLLIEDVPGVGKTVLAKALARSIGGTFSRIQFTPDMLPSDVTGVAIYNQKRGEFEFRPGPIMAQVVLADEINRATPKTQSALLEAMEERQVTVDGVTYPLEQPFLVLATQNPIEYEGTFPLPEAQLDRFLMRLSLGYPTLDEQVAIFDAQHREHPLERLQRVTTTQELVQAQSALQLVYVDPSIKRYIAQIVEATRHQPDMYLGASPRGALALYRAACAYALLRGRDYVLPDDVKALVIPTLAHRLILNASARVKGLTSAQVLNDLLTRIPAPGARVR